MTFINYMLNNMNIIVTNIINQNVAKLVNCILTGLPQASTKK